MLIQFSTKNFLSFKDLATFSMVTDTIKEHPANYFSQNSTKLLKSSIVCGPNASGKSNLIKALGFFKYFVINSFSEIKVNSKIPIDSYRLSDETKNKPSHFEIIFIQNEIQYRYGFEADQDRVYNEWLFSAKKKKETQLFVRGNTDSFEVNKREFKEGVDISSKTRPNALFLSVVAQFNGEISKQIINWFNNFIVLTNIEPLSFRGLTINLINTINTYKSKITEFMKIADLGIDNFDIKKIESKEAEAWLQLLPEEVRNKVISDGLYTIKTQRKRYSSNKEFSELEEFDMGVKESAGTNKLFDLSGPIIDTLESGKVLIIDELDTSMHPIITQFIIKLFHSENINKNNAQLVFTTHDIKLLDKAIFRRDQIWFTDKNKFGESDLYSLIEYRRSKTRNDASYAKDYLAGKYGAIPVITNQLEALFLGKINEQK